MMPCIFWCISTECYLIQLLVCLNSILSNQCGLLCVARLKNNRKFSYEGPRTKDGIIDFANRVAG